MRTAIMMLAVICALAQAPGLAVSARAKIGKPVPAAKISRYLFGSFVELLDDLVPGMRAEMLNDRGFDGVLPCANWCYYNGLPNTCDREWNPNTSWSYDSPDPFNGARSVRLEPATGQPATLTQAGLATKTGMTYLFSGYFHSHDPKSRLRVILKAQLPDGKWVELGSSPLPSPASQWGKLQCKILSAGTTDRAVFELKASGSGPIWASRLSLMPADNLEGWRKDVVQAIKEAHPCLIRWGGSVCDPGGYKWKDGIGDQDHRTPFANKVWGRIDSNDVGIDEFLQFCELVDAQPMICLSFADGAQSAHDLVEYCNGSATSEWGLRRAANGHKKPYGVKFWQIGNELGDETYVNGCAEFCKAIKEADPKALILSSYPSKALLEKAGSLLDFVCPHHYTPDLNACEASFGDVGRVISSTAGCQRIRVGVTEWNITGGSFGLERSRLLTLDAALANACYLNLLLRHSDLVQIACRSNMTNSMCSGMIQTNEAGLYKTPSYYVMKLYADHARGIYAPVEGALNGVDAAATVSEDGKSLCVLAVNRSTEPIELSVDLSAYAGLQLVSAESVRDTQDTRQAEVVNGWALPERIRATRLEVGSEIVTLPALSATAIELKTR